MSAEAGVAAKRGQANAKAARGVRIRGRIMGKVRAECGERRGGVEAGARDFETKRRSRASSPMSVYPLRHSLYIP